MKKKVMPTGEEIVMRDDDFITSKTDLKGIITYCNEIFIEFARYQEEQLVGQNHNIIRHPDMPRTIYKLLWDTIQSGQEINAYVKNMASDGAFYWVLANVTPVFDKDMKIVGYYSVRRKPKKSSLDRIIPLYKQLLSEEKKYGSSEGLSASTNMLNQFLSEKGVDYEKFVLTI